MDDLPVPGMARRGCDLCLTKRHGSILWLSVSAYSAGICPCFPVWRPGVEKSKGVPAVWDIPIGICVSAFSANAFPRTNSL